MRPPTAAQLDRGLAATWGRPETSPRSPAVIAPRPRQPKLRKWTPHRSGSLLGFVTVELASGIVLGDLRIMTGKSGLWIAMPAIKQIDRNGNPRLDASGRSLFNQIIEFRDRKTSDRFNRTVLDLMRAAHPEALEDRS
jgi:hypothetical protein